MKLQTATRLKKFMNLFRKQKVYRAQLTKAYDDATLRMAKQIRDKIDAEILEELRK